jgi:two-component system alkaline phosphatase synthesis response regulator PhoP/two-component system response regulator VicR
VLIVEDEPDIAMSLAVDLRCQGHEPVLVTDGEQAIVQGAKAGWDLILLDVMLPKVDGFDACAELRRLGVRTPIIMLTARTHDTEKEIGLDAGADDYVGKPFSVRELRARIRAQLRRGTQAADRVVRFGSCEVDLRRGQVRREGVTVDVTAQEWRLLTAFITHRGRLLTRDQLISAAWGHGVTITDRTVDTHVFNLRRKLEASPSEPRWIVGVRGLGYRFEDEP